MPMPDKLVRFARVIEPKEGSEKGSLKHYAAHYRFPDIQANDGVLFVSLYLRVTLTFKSAAHGLFEDPYDLFQPGPPLQFVIEPCYKEVKGKGLEEPLGFSDFCNLPAKYSGRILTATESVNLDAKLRNSNILVTAEDVEHPGNPNGHVNYSFGTIDPCW